MMNRKYWGKFSSISTALAAALSASCVGEVEPGVAVENIQGGSPPDVTVDAMGNVAIGDPRQWARDASVRMSGPTTLCSGTLVSPRVVLTNAHCVRRELPIGVHFSPLNPNGDRGIVVPGAREIVEAGIIRCEIHPERDGACGDGFTYGSPQENDLAVLVLDQRFDATPGSPYPVTPAHVVENDPGNIPGGWTFQQAWMAGYGQEGVFPDSGTNTMRLVATTHIASVSFREFLTAHMRGRAGDSAACLSSATTMAARFSYSASITRGTEVPASQCG